MDNKYAGMTVNERLFASGLLDDFDKAIDSKDALEVRVILKLVELTEANIAPILSKLDLNESK